MRSGTARGSGGSLGRSLDLLQRSGALFFFQLSSVLLRKYLCISGKARSRILDCFKLHRPRLRKQSAHVPRIGSCVVFKAEQRFRKYRCFPCLGISLYADHSISENSVCFHLFPSFCIVAKCFPVFVSVIHSPFIWWVMSDSLPASYRDCSFFLHSPSRVYTFRYTLVVSE